MRVGAWTFFSEDGAVAGRGEYVDGKRSGPWRLPALDGRGETVVRFDAGLPVDGESQVAASCRPLPDHPGACYRLDVTPGLEPRLDPDLVARTALAAAHDGSEDPPFRQLRLRAFVRRHRVSGESPDASDDPGWSWSGEEAAGIYWIARAEGPALVPLHAVFHGIRGRSGYLLISDRSGWVVGSGTP